MKAGRLWKRSPVTKAYRSRNHLGTLFIAFLGYAIEGGLVLYFRAGREVKAIREDCPPGKEEGKRCCHLSRPVSRGVGNPDRLRESLALLAPFVSPTKKSSLTISHSFPVEPPLLAIRCFRLSITYPGALLFNH